VAIPDVKTNSKKRRTSGDALLIALLVAEGAIIVCLRLIVFQPFSIPSGSMVPTLVPGDYVLVSKISYGYGPYSLPLATAGLSHRIPASWLPERGDVVVFRVTGKTAVDFIKRVVGRPGDRVQMTKGVLSINGVAVPRQRIGDTTIEGSNQHGTRYRETLPSGVSYITLSLDDNGIYATTPEYTVPAGHYFVLGDNRNNSVDSRMLDQVGYVPVENMIGRAELIVFSSQSGVRWERVFQVVR